ncbi:MAG: hypothetical protein V9E94_15000 [Microthrixaceae bacterium]
MTRQRELPTVAIVGAGIVGARVARELLGPDASGRPSVERVILLTRRRERRERLSAAFGREVEVKLCGDDVEVPEGIDVVVIARETGEHCQIAREQIEGSRHVVSTGDDPDEIREMAGLDAPARERGASLVLGTAMSPGLTCLLSAHAATMLDRVDEIHVSRHGVAGPACARQRLRALRGGAFDWRDGEWVRRPGFSGRELSWFPDPVGGRDCYRADLGEPLLLQPAFPTAQRITARLAASRRDRALAPFPVLLPPPAEGGLGAIRVELRGERAGERVTVVYGALDRPAIAAGALAAVVALEAGAGRLPVGAAGLGGTDRHVEILAELARRGVRAAVFEGDRAGVDAQVVGENTTDRAQGSAPDADI